MDDVALLHNSSASFDDIRTSGAPSWPLPFERPTPGWAERVDAPVYNPVTRDTLEASNIIHERHQDGRRPIRAYWVGKKLKKIMFGVVKECTILRCRNDDAITVPWELTSHRAAVKIMSWQMIREHRHFVDPQQEVAAMQYVSRNGPHPHVMGALDVLQDEEYLLMFMPFCSSSDLFGFVRQAGRFEESVARYWFKQILESLTHLQRMGICHRDMSLENILVDDSTTSMVIALGLCLRVPYGSPDGGSDVVDVSAGTLRRLIKPQVPCGKPNYISPEVWSSTEPFDGFAIDLWASAVMLFIMLVGRPPWESPREDDPRYRMVVRGGLARMLHGWNRDISPMAADLLQRMLVTDPRQRLSLQQVKDHPWTTSDEVSGGADYGWHLPLDEP